MIFFEVFDNLMGDGSSFLMDFEYFAGAPSLGKLFGQLSRCTRHGNLSLMFLALSLLTGSEKHLRDNLFLDLLEDANHDNSVNLGDGG